jgi:hypothetical protein
MLKRQAAIALLALAAASVIHAQQGARQPPPVKEHTFDLESSYIRMPVPPGDEKYGRIDGYRLKEHVKALTAMARKYHDAGQRYWGRLPATKADVDAEAYIAAKFREYGLQDVHMEPVKLVPQWTPVDWSFSASGSGTVLTPKTIYPAEKSVNTPAGGMTLDVVWAGLGTELDFAGRDVRGKMVFLHSDPRPNGFQQTARYTGAMQRAVEKGAVAVLVNVNIPGNVVNSFAPAPKVPTFGIGTADAEALKALMVKGPVTAKMTLTAEMRPNLTSNNVWGALPGTGAEDVLIFGHHDGMFEGAFDNASGIATILGIAEYFSKVPQTQRKRTIRFVATAAHTSNAEGARAIMAQRETLLKNTVLVINSEHTSITQMTYFGEAGIFRTNTTGARRWWINGSDKFAAMVFDTYRKFGVAIWDWEMYDGGGIGPFAHEITSLQLLDSPVYFSSDHDRDDIVTPPGLESVARAYAKIIDQSGAFSRAELQQPPQATTSAGVSR